MKNMGLGIFLMAALSVGGTSALADELDIDIRQGCEEAFLILPGAMMLHDQIAADHFLDELGAATQAAETLLETGRYDFPSRAIDLPSSGHLLPGKTISREQLKTFHRTTKNLARLIVFQSKWVAAYYEWVNEEPTPILKKTRKLSAQAAKDGKPLRVERKSKQDWLRSEAAAEFRRIETRVTANQPSRQPAFSGAERQQLIALENEMEAHHEIPEYFLIWMNAHSQSARHYGISESSLYFELVTDLHDLFQLGGQR